mgnify:CR=1 FL=1
MSCPNDHESSFLTPRERSVLRVIEEQFRASDGTLDVALSDGVLPVSPWLLWAGRAALILIPLVLLLPFVGWSSIVVVVLGFVMLKPLSRLSHRRGSGRGSRSGR